MVGVRTLDIFFVAGALRRYWKRAAGFFVGALLLVTAAILFAPREYGSEARLFMRVGRESVALDPTAITGQMIALNETRQSEVASALELLESRALREAVVDRLGPEVFLDSPAGEGTQADTGQVSWWTKVVHVLEAIGALDAVDRREKAVRALSRKMEAWVPRNTHVIAVSCRSKKAPEQAQAIVQAIVECFREMHLRAHRAQRSYDFFALQSQDLQEMLDSAAQRLQERKSELGLLTIEGQRALLEQQRAAVQQELIATLTNLSAARAKVEALATSLRELPEREVAEQVDGLPNIATDTMRHALYTLEMEEQALAAKYTEEHPHVKAKRDQLREARGVLEQQTNSRTQTTTNLSPTKQPLQLAKLVEAAEVKAWEARRASLETDAARLAEAVRALNRQEVEIASLERDLALIEADYRSYAERKEQSRIDQVLAADGISSANVVQAPTLVRKPVSPRKLLTLLFGLAAAVGGSLSLVLLSAWFDRSFQSETEVELALNLPVLLTVPRWRSNGVHPHQLSRTNP